MRCAGKTPPQRIPYPSTGTFVNPLGGRHFPNQLLKYSLLSKIPPNFPPILEPNLKTASCKIAATNLAHPKLGGIRSPLFDENPCGDPRTPDRTQDAPSRCKTQAVLSRLVDRRTDKRTLLLQNTVTTGQAERTALQTLLRRTAFHHCRKSGITRVTFRDRGSERDKIARTAGASKKCLQATVPVLALPTISKLRRPPPLYQPAGGLPLRRGSPPPLHW
jgi:hypothetical protein